MMQHTSAGRLTRLYYGYSSRLDIKPRKVSYKEVKPFTAGEIKTIIAGFDILAPHYIPFVRFLFFSAVRISEAIGLRWGHVDFDRNEFTICESLSKDVTGNGYKRTRKATKTGSIRHLDMSHELRALLQGLKPDSPASDRLVFTTKEGCTIGTDNFRARYWKPILAECHIPYRKIHTTRHTTLTEILHHSQQGVAKETKI